MVGLGVDKEVEPSGLCNGLNMESEGRERSGCWFLGAETEHLGEWGRWSEKENARVLFGPVIFMMNDLVSRKDLTLHCGAAFPTPVLGDLQFKVPWLRSSVMSWGGPTRRCKLGLMFTSWSELVVVADSSGRNNRIRPQGTKRQASPSFRVGDCPLYSIHPRLTVCMLF